MKHPTIIEKQKLLFKRKKNLVENATPAEKKMKRLLEYAEIEYMFQKAFIAKDFFCIVDFYLPKPHKLCIEVDGSAHDLIEQVKKDKRKENYLVKKRGFRLLRFTNEQVFQDPIGVLRKIKIILKRRTNPYPDECV